MENNCIPLKENQPLAKKSLSLKSHGSISKRLRKSDTLHVKYSAVYFDRIKPIGSITATQFSLKSIEFLSVRDNYLKTISFITELPNLWYLDIRNNQIESFEALKQKFTFGFLGVSPGVYTLGQFLSLTKLTIGIFQIDGDFDKETQAKLTAMLYHPSNSFLMANGEILIFEKEFNSGSICSTNSNANCSGKVGLPQVNDNATSSPIPASPIKRFSLNTHRMSTPISIDDEKNSPRIDRKSLVLSEESSQKTQILTRFIEKFFKPRITDIILNVVSEIGKDGRFKEALMPNKFGKRLSSKLHEIPTIDFKGLPEYIELEREKILFVFKIFRSFHGLHTKVYNFNEQEIGKNPIKNIDFNILLCNSNDTAIQCFIVEILIMYLLGVMDKGIVQRIYQILFTKQLGEQNVEKLQSCIQYILNMEPCLILGYYFYLYEHLMKLVLEKASKGKLLSPFQNSPSTPNSIDDVKWLFNLTTLVLKVNDLKKQQIENLTIYSHSDLTFQIRKKYIKEVILKYIEKDLQILPQIIKIIQHIHDFLLMNKYDMDLILHVPESFKVFQEIRSCIFNHLNKGLEKKVFSTLSERVLNDYIISHFSKELHLKNDGSTSRIEIGRNKDKKKMIIQENDYSEYSKKGNKMLIMNYVNKISSMKSSQDMSVHATHRHHLTSMEVKPNKLLLKGIHKQSRKADMTSHMSSAGSFRMSFPVNDQSKNVLMQNDSRDYNSIEKLKNLGSLHQKKAYTHKISLSKTHKYLSPQALNLMAIKISNGH